MIKIANVESDQEESTVHGRWKDGPQVSCYFKLRLKSNQIILFVPPKCTQLRCIKVKVQEKHLIGHKPFFCKVLDQAFGVWKLYGQIKHIHKQTFPVRICLEAAARSFKMSYHTGCTQKKTHKTKLGVWTVGCSTVVLQVGGWISGWSEVQSAIDIEKNLAYSTCTFVRIGRLFIMARMSTKWMLAGQLKLIEGNLSYNLGDCSFNTELLFSNWKK